jgi:hypothetical protein
MFLRERPARFTSTVITRDPLLRRKSRSSADTTPRDHVELRVTFRSVARAGKGDATRSVAITEEWGNAARTQAPNAPLAAVQARRKAARQDAQASSTDIAAPRGVDPRADQFSSRPPSRRQGRPRAHAAAGDSGSAPSCRLPTVFTAIWGRRTTMISLEGLTLADRSSTRKPVPSSDVRSVTLRAASSRKHVPERQAAASIKPPSATLGSSTLAIRRYVAEPRRSL